MSAEARGSDLDARVWDAVVVGAGPAGALFAFELGRAGAEVLLLDRQAFPRWKVCGCCLSPGTQSVLHEAGLARILDEVGTVPLHTLRLAGWSAVADIMLGPSVAMSRSALDAALVRAAASVGVTFVAPARARLGPCHAGHRTLFVEIAGVVTDVRARVVIAADGLGSPLLAEALHGGRDAGIAPWSRIGFGALFPTATPGYPAGVIHMAVGSEGYVGLVRLEDGTLDVAGALDPAVLGGGTRPEAAVRGLLERAGFPALDGTPTEGWRGTPRLTRRATTRGADRLLAVGDASGYVEPFTGEGMAWALSGARTLAPIALEGIRDWRPELVRAWDRRYEETIGAAARLCRGLSWALRRPALARRGLRALSRLPFLAAPFVARAARSPSRPTTVLATPPRRTP
ncbi:MAG TPA: FAD-dependent monooxygenase [Longimicrobiales bacterium]|nr:FAD-dependent monooxygenase [Longimicrobiales bacterium]